MNSQDANINLCIIKNDESKKGVLKMQHNNGNVSLSFFKELESDNKGNTRQQKRFSQIPDHVHQLSDFTKIEMDQDDQLILILSGSRCQFKLLFDKQAGISNFFDYICQKVCLKHSDCNPRVFLIESLDSSTTSIAPFMATVLPGRGSKVTPNRISLAKIKESYPMVNFTIDNDVKKMTAEQYRELFDADGKIKEGVGFPSVFYNVDVDPSVAGDLWKIIINKDSEKKNSQERAEDDKKNLEIYSKIKRQWLLTSRKQWDNHTDLRSLVDALEKGIKAQVDLFKGYEHVKEAQTIAFNVLLTISYYNRDHALYCDGLIPFLMPFLEPFVKDAHDNVVVTHDGKEVPVEEAESNIFWCFFKFYDNNKLYDLIKPSKTPTIKTIFTNVGNLLFDNYNPLLELLIQKHAFSLDFLRDDCNAMFSTCLNPCELRRFWMSLLTYPAPFKFYEVFIISLLFSLSPSFVEMNPLNSEEFVHRFHDLKKSLNLNMLLDNSFRLMNQLYPQQQ
ncbi:hypothetical protein TVAG_363750 [Trichomonas vaginalis G3]|uniref:Rab-GAP TBC domain-containing protein n=1 Tax=Trichomonas vaginalis (strain ATCC PRA-98 / G3) TaxID=412133 RepID=A2EDU4_TRIV3|nr:regulation of vesicle fusion [Trichomonas vaginalis G3]EAY09160.1 hypothetical protein TVAG_363750 [Trichomonas vaginalis G3]KAI5487051.1 regulation of vesicle fusion [Trichomonas vaginalis G3]|eukprot:XP_001321383.1 hypothetical protein [Trichomonas vaginalis G3]